MRDIRSNKKINIHKNNPASIGRFKQRSNATLILDLYDEFSNYVDLSNQEISIRVERPDGVTFEQIDNITKNSNILTIKLKNEVLEIEGKCRVELNLKDSEGQMNTADFFFEVGESVLNDDIVFSSDSYESLEKALVVFRTESNSLMKKLDDNEKIRLSNESTRKSQETGRVNAENSRISKENERVSQENTRKSQEEARKSNENTRQNQERGRQESENTRKSQETNRVNKENERKNNEDTRKTNESDRQTRFTKLESDGRKLMAEMNTAIDGTITREVTEARGTKAKLGLRLNDMEQQSVENTSRIEQLEDLTPVWQEHEGTGNITVNDSFDGVAKDLVVKGRTLFNTVTSKNGQGVFGFDSNLKAWTNKAGKLSGGLLCKNVNLKPNTTYTIIYNVLKNLDDSRLNLDSHSNYVAKDNIDIPREEGIQKKAFSTKETFDGITEGFVLKITTWNEAATIEAGSLVIDNKIIILEGDWTNKEVFREYFDSITSVGEQEDNKIKLKSVGKNLFNSTFEIGGITGNTGLNYDSSTHCRSGFIKVPKNSDITVSGLLINESMIFLYDSNKNYIRYLNKGDVSTYTISTDNVSYVRLRSRNLDNINNSLIMIEEGSVATNHEQYRSKLIEIPLPFAKGLKSTLDGTIFDEINGNTGEIIQRVSDEYTALAKPIIHKINDIQLKTFDETTHITQENNILSDINFKAKVSLSSQAKRLIEENKVLKEENIELREHSIKTIEEQEIQDQKITTTMLANTELFEMMLNFIPMKLDDKQFRGGEMNMVEVYVTLIIQGDKTLEQVPTIIRPKVEAKLRLLGVIA